jgi:hypothetical protein
VAIRELITGIGECFNQLIDQRAKIRAFRPKWERSDHILQNLCFIGMREAFRP